MKTFFNASDRENHLVITCTQIAVEDLLKSDALSDEEHRELIKEAQKQAVKGFADLFKRTTMVTAKYDDGTIIYQTSNKLIDQMVEIYFND